MTSPRTRLMAVAGVVAAGVIWFTIARQPPSAERPPEVWASAAAAVPLPLDTERGLRQFEQRVVEDPRDFISFTMLGQLHARRARETGDLAGYRRAEEAFAQALRLKADHTAARTLLASAYASQHKFAEALGLARSLYDKSPNDLGALATIVDASFETGDYRGAEEALRTLMQRAGNEAAVLARRALLAELKGHPEDAIKLITQARDSMLASAQPAQEIAWYETRLADLYFHSGCLAEAEEHSSAALNLFTDYHIGLSGLADVRAAQGRVQDAVDLLARVRVKDPGTFFTLGALYDRLQQPDAARQHYVEGEKIARRADLHQPAYYRELALHYAEQPTRVNEALDLARKDLELRKDIEGYDTLAWALYRSNRLDEAAAAIVEALKLGTHEPGFHYHAGMIYQALGQSDKAREHLQRAHDLSPYMLPDDGRQMLMKLGGRERPAAECKVGIP